jgi:zinc-ribbon domain
MSVPTSCSSCGAKITPNDRFCGVCGAELGGRAPAGAFSAEAPAEPVPSASAAATPQGKSGATFNKTMLGMVLPQGLIPGGPSVPAPQPTPLAAPESPTPAAVPKPVPQRTMLGMAAPLIGDLAKLQVPVPSGPRSASPGGVPKETLLGVSPAAPPPGSRSEVAWAEPSAAWGPPHNSGPHDSGPHDSGPDDSGFGGADTAESLSASTKKAKLPAQTDRTMLGIAAPKLPPPPTEPVAERKGQDEGSPGARKRSFTPVNSKAVGARRPSAAQAPALRWLWLAVGALAVLAIGGGTLAWLSSRGPALRVRVVTEAGVESLEIEAPGSRPEAKLRFLGAEQSLSAGRARFPLKADALTIGENHLVIDLIERNGDVDSSAVTLKVAYRVRLDSAKLAAATPEVEVLVDAVPGSKVLLDGAELALNEHGHGQRAYPIAPQSGGVFGFVAKVRVEPPGEPAQEKRLELSLPLASMQLGRPGPETVTDQPLIEVAGAVETGAQVDLAGKHVEVIDGRFVARVPLPAPGTHMIKVVARAKGKAPRVAEIKVERVTDLTLAAASFTPDPALTYARIAQNPVMYRGQKVAFDGRVYNVEVDAGRSVLQMLVLDCPGQSRCPLWVEYPQATEATLDSWVRVLGVVAGEQQFRSKQGGVQTVPSVHAQYVLKLARK